MSMSVRTEQGEERKQRGRASPDLDQPNLYMLRVVLVGKTGAGKSSSGNTILGRKAFRASQSGSSVTKECWKETGDVAGRRIVLVDTPGLFNTELSEKELEQEISKCINMTAPEPHAIILVISLGPFTKEQELSVEKIRAIFGEEADKHIVILFTHGDDLSCTIEECLSSSPKPLQDLVRRCGRRYHVFNNKEMQDRMQVLDFLEKVDSMIAANTCKFYTSDLFSPQPLCLPQVSPQPLCLSQVSPQRLCRPQVSPQPLCLPQVSPQPLCLSQVSPQPLCLSQVSPQRPFPQGQVFLFRLPRPGGLRLPRPGGLRLPHPGLPLCFGPLFMSLHRGPAPRFACAPSLPPPPPPRTCCLERPEAAH